MSFASGPWGSWNIAVTADGKLTVEAYLNSGAEDVNKTLFDELHVDARAWEQRVGQPMSWDRRDQSRVSRIAAKHSFADLADPAERAELKGWAVGASLGLYDALNDALRLRVRELREVMDVRGQGDSAQVPATTGLIGEEPFSG